MWSHTAGEDHEGASALAGSRTRRSTALCTGGPASRGPARVSGLSPSVRPLPAAGTWFPCPVVSTLSSAHPAAQTTGLQGRLTLKPVPSGPTPGPATSLPRTLAESPFRHLWGREGAGSRAGPPTRSSSGTSRQTHRTPGPWLELPQVVADAPSVGGVLKGDHKPSGTRTHSLWPPGDGSGVKQ